MMTLKRSSAENKNWLQEHGFLQDLESKECETLLDIVDTYRAIDGEFLFEEGERDDEIFIIRAGSVELGYRVVKHDTVDLGTYGSVDMDDGDEDPHWVTKVNLGVGECFGEPDISKATPHTMSARAVGEVELICLAARPLRDRMQDSNKVCKCLGDALCASIEKLLQQKYG